MNLPPPHRSLGSHLCGGHVPCPTRSEAGSEASSEASSGEGGLGGVRVGVRGHPGKTRWMPTGNSFSGHFCLLHTISFKLTTAGEGEANNDFCPFPSSRLGWSLPQTPWGNHSSPLPPNLQHFKTEHLPGPESPGLVVCDSSLHHLTAPSSDCKPLESRDCVGGLSCHTRHLLRRWFP